MTVPILPEDREQVDRLCAYIYERMGFVRISAEIVQKYIDLGDMCGMDYALQRIMSEMDLAKRARDRIFALRVKSFETQSGAQNS